MSDLCSPMIVLLDDEADAFWCFERLMRRLVDFPFILMRLNFVKLFKIIFLCIFNSFNDFF